LLLVPKRLERSLDDVFVVTGCSLTCPQARGRPRAPLHQGLLHALHRLRREIVSRCTGTDDATCTIGQRPDDY